MLRKVDVVMAGRRGWLFRAGGVSLVVPLALSAGAWGGATAVSAKPSAPSMQQTFTSTLAPTPSFVAAAGSKLSLTQQTVTGLAQQRYGETPGLTAAQRAAAQGGMISSLTYPVRVAPSATVVASALGVLALQNSAPESSTAPGCSSNTGGSVSRVTIERPSSGNGTTYRLTVSRPEGTGFAPLGSWPVAGRPIAVAVLDPNCSYDGASSIAITYPDRVDYFNYVNDAQHPFGPAGADGDLTPSGTWLPDDATVLASAHVNADSSYLPVQQADEGDGQSTNPVNATMLVVTATRATAQQPSYVLVHRLQLTQEPSSTVQQTILDAGLELPQKQAAAPTAASIAYDNNASEQSDYAVATRSGSTNSVWFGEIAHSGNQDPTAEPKACAGSGIPRFSVADVKDSDATATGVACTTTKGSSTVTERWSNFTTNINDTTTISFPTKLHNSSTTMPTLAAARPYVTWPCVLLSESAQQQGQTHTCSSDAAIDVIGAPKDSGPRLYTVGLNSAARTVSHALAGGLANTPVDVAQLPLDATSITVHNSSPTAVLAHTSPTPLVYLMPAPMISGLDQPAGGPPVSFGTSRSKGHGRSASFQTSIGGTVAATIGEPEIAAADLSVSAEKATGTTQDETSSISSAQSLNDNGNEPLVVYSVTPVWRWTGQVTADSTGLGTANEANVVTQIAVNKPSEPATLNADSVTQLASHYKQFRRTGLYGPSLQAVFGAGVFGGNGRTVAHADPSQYPHFVPGHTSTPRYGSTAYCDTHSGSRGVATLNSGVTSPFTDPDATASGPSFLLAAQAPQTVVVGDSASDASSVSIDHGSSTSYSTDFTVSASAGVTIGGVSVTADAGFSVGNDTNVSTSSSQTFSVEIGHITGASGSQLPAALRQRIDRALSRSETYTWDPFVCHRTTSLPGGGQTSALVLGFETYGFKGAADVGSPRAPHPATGSTSAKNAKSVAQRSRLTLHRVGPAAAYQATVEQADGHKTTTLTTTVLTPSQAAQSARTQTLRLPKLSPGVYRWRPTAITYNGDTRAGAWRWFRIG